MDPISKQEYSFISDKVDFRLKAVRRDSEGHFILINGTTQQEDISFFTYIYREREREVPNYIKKTLLDLKAQIDPNAVMVGDLNIQLSPRDR
jgi:hypothetical protein